ncbi:NADH:ubiquinone oxidoreductase subunit NDUFA12 [Paracoccus sp. JM45]|uniref:NADH:ubiquinone oxidoreductase subunit NDUFA12 n=1 Tax=Paracoccus sp. JM45 TaxID=2283626 RepID=UPI000E6BA770|nr:NADH:ubiquinone oxidoreductase subunit NDUFA12 [Paracoccus sp. JM45]RJE81154.1 NADH:ubiquinone oxidoreductase subunit NDUFA12 [Paracoccus sp. JM45]
MSYPLRFLTWWNSQTLNTQFWTWRNGIKVGEDGNGNVFYKSKDSKRRWVIYNGEAEASRISPDWHGWLHHTWNEPPTEVAVPTRTWSQPHKPNMTGTTEAYVPAGSISRVAPVSRSDYDAWQPE